MFETSNSSPLHLRVVVPTYNEAATLEPLLRAILAHPWAGVVVVDDNSPDGTGAIADRLAAETGRVDVVHRAGKLGLGTAYRAGYKRALELGAEYVMTMDCDFSHDPAALPAFAAAAENYDMVIGSRYLHGVSVINWPMRRILLSWFANNYVRTITGLSLTDCTSGYRLYRRELLQGVGLEQMKSSGYSFLVEMACRATWLGYRVGEVQITFTERREGKSKMSKRDIAEAAIRPIRLRLGRLLGYPKKARR
jgi:dolichol-phosphate mannosyltransferase